MSSYTIYNLPVSIIMPIAAFFHCFDQQCVVISLLNRFDWLIIGRLHLTDTRPIARFLTCLHFSSKYVYYTHHLMVFCTTKVYSFGASNRGDFVLVDKTIKIEHIWHLWKLDTIGTFCYTCKTEVLQAPSAREVNLAQGVE